METLRQDIRYALRSLRRQPAFAALSILTLALGIGANAAIFTVVNAVLLRPLPYDHPDRLVALTTEWRRSGARATVSAPDYHDWHDGTQSFEAMASYIGGETSVLVDGVADYANAIRVTPELFNVFRSPAQIGRVLGSAEHQPNAPLSA